MYNDLTLCDLIGNSTLAKETLKNYHKSVRAYNHDRRIALKKARHDNRVEKQAQRIFLEGDK